MTKTVSVYGTDYSFEVSTFGENVGAWAKSLKGAATTVENADNLFGRSALVALLSGSITPANMALAAYAAFKPVNAKGKAVAPKLQGTRVESVSSLRTAKGGDAARKALDALFSIHATMSDEAALDRDGANLMVPAVLAYINADKGGASSPRVLDGILAKAAAEEALRKMGPVGSDEVEDEAPAEDKGDVPAQASPSDAILALAAFLESASDDELAAVGEEMAILMEVINGRFDVAVAPVEVAEAA